MMIERGDLIFVKNKGFLFDKIRNILNSDTDHVGIMLTDNTLIDATLAGVKIRPLTVFDGLEYCVYRLKPEYAHHIDEMLNYCTSKLGCGYDFIQIISLYFLILLGIKKTLNPIDIGNAFVCSELIAQSAECAGFSFQDEMATDRITPLELQQSEKVFKV